MADALLSGSLQLLFDRLASPELINFIQAQNLSHEFLTELKRKLLVVHNALNDAEMKQFSEPLVKGWLVQAKDAVYHAEDLLDEIVTEALIEAADPQTGGISTGINPSFANQSMESRVTGLITMLENIEQERAYLGLKEGEKEKVSPRPPSSCLVDESFVFGREQIKEEMLQWLLLSDKKKAVGSNVDVMSIVGIGGSGKTTLAQLLYNHERVNQHFQLKAWISVSTEALLIEEVTKAFLKEVGCTTKSDDSLNSLQLKLKDSVGNKKFLLVLDDVWDMKSLDWDGLRIPILAAANGSKIVVTSRTETAARIMEAVTTHHLEKLSPEDSWSLFKKLAFTNGDPSANPQLESIGREIVNKCQGLPLAVKALGSMLNYKTEEKEWEDISKASWYSQINQEILPSLALSYQHLSPPAKRCFAYCSIFPKDYKFQKEKLILLWMAEGLLDAGQGDERMEDVGESCFNELVSNLLFQKSLRKESCFVMHDLIHDLAQHISGEFCVLLEDDKAQKITDKARHFLYFKSDIDQMVLFQNFEAVGEVQHLRTFFHVKRFAFFIIFRLSQRVLQNILPKFKSLRVLSLSHYRMTDVPDSIHTLKQLRYLDLSSTRIRKLPESICCLFNLQTLILNGCHFLLELPSKIGKLINLRYLDVTGVFQMKEMPHDIHQLRSLQQLPYVIVAKESGFGIGGLSGFSDIRGVLEISKMENVVRAEDALQANMKDKRYVDKLSLKWDGRISNEVTGSGAVEDILDKLQPHQNLKHLSLVNFPGATFPDWLGDSSFLNLGSVKLSGCGNCSTLPPLGQLPCLKHLEISKMKGVVRVGSEFSGNSSFLKLNQPPFPSLQTLSFEDMLNWEKWLCCEGRDEVLPRLRELSIKLCPKFTGALPMHLDSLEEVNVENCPLLLVPTLNVPAIRGLHLKRQTCGFTPIDTSEIEISGVSELKQLPAVPVNLYLTKCDHVESVLEEVLETNMDKLRIYDCCFSRSPSKVGIPSTLRLLTISNCTKVDLLLHQLFRCHHPVLQNLWINGGTYGSTVPLSFSVSEIFPSLTYFGIYRLEGLEKLCISISEGNPASLRNLEINGCADLEYVELPGLDSMCNRISYCSKLRQLVHTHSSLQKLTLEHCPELLFPQDGFPSDLRELQIWFCNKLTAQVDGDLRRLSSLTKFTIMGGFEDLESFPNQCLLPSSLTSLSISSLPNLKSLYGKGLQQLSSLVKLHITRCSELQSLTGYVLQHLVCLKELQIHSCRRLQSLTEAGLHYLNALEILDIQGCRELQYLTEKRLPDSISCLIVDHCPLLEQQCAFEKGPQWCYISHIPKILINDVLL